MMTTSYPHNATMHPQGMPHGHPMGGPGPNPGQPMPPGMQHVSGPNGPVSQAGPMMGMQPGMGPNAHALSHLQPQQAHMFQQQQQQMMNHPAMLQQHNRNQQHAYMRQQQQQAMLAQQQGGMGMGFQNPMGNMNPQQMAAIRAGQLNQQFVNLPPHLHLQQQQQQMQNQQQAGPQQAAALAQAQAQAHHQAQQQQQAQQAQQQQQQQHMQQHAIAMQHAQSQSSNHSQAGNQGPPPTTQPQQGPLRPPSAVGSHQGQSSPAPQPTPQQQPQQPPQPPQQQPPQSGPVQQQQTPTPVQPPNLPQQPNQQAQNQAQMQQRNSGMAQQAQAHAQAQQARSLMMKQQQHQHQQQQQQQQAQSQSAGQGTLKLMNFVNQIGKYTTEVDTNREDNSIERWQTFVDKFFTETGSFIHVVCSTATERTKQFEIVYAALPRYFYTLFNTDVTSLQITLDGATEKTATPELKVTCDRAKFVYTYRNQCQVVYHGKLTAFWSGSDKMEWLQFEGQGHEQFIPLATLKQMFHQPSPNQMNPNQSPRMNKAAKQKQQQRAAQEPPEPYLPISKLLSAGTTDYGLPHALQSYLEIYETMNNMTSLMTHYLEHSNMKPSEALESWITTMSNTNAAGMATNPGQGQPHQGMQQPNMPPGARPPGPGQPGQMFMSPAMANSLLPNGAMSGSPGMMHTPSPASHQMVKQQSTSSHTASVNTSPSMNNKRRRSTAKIEIDDGGGGDVNGSAPKVKQSPRGGGGKRMKANNN